ncbi:MAG TPA: hypothetical protein VJ063_07830 [Verrucomicrobiae bacterium]|nr:hypothetical protein [Verrucomicrobiae bacterium]
MKRALRSTDTTMFIKSDGGETQCIDKARSFLSYDDAVAFCRGKQLKNVELVVHMDDQSELTLALPSSRLAEND